MASASISLTIALWGNGPSKMLAARLGGPHAGGHALADQRNSSSAMAPMMVNIARPIGLSVST